MWYRNDIIRQFRRSIRDEQDIHARMMSVYKEVPVWWYAAIFVVAFIFGVIAIEIFPTQFPVWALVLSLLISVVFVIPIGIIRAVTNQLPALNVLSELVAGYALPGRPVGAMVFKTFGFVPTYQAMFFLNDLKIGHYQKIPPRVMFMAQVIASTLAVFVCVGVQEWQFANIEDFCMPTQKDGFVCNDISTFATAAIIWGGIGPRRLFSSDGMYNWVLYFFLIGAILPIPFYVLARWYPTRFYRYVNIPVCFAGLAQLPPAVDPAVIIQYEGGSSSTTPDEDSIAKLSGAVSTDPTSSSGDNNDSWLSKYGTIVLGLLGANLLVGIVLLAVSVTMCVRGMKGRSVGSRYTPVRFKDNVEDFERGHAKYSD